MGRIHRTYEYKYLGTTISMEGHLREQIKEIKTWWYITYRETSVLITKKERGS